MSPCRDIKYYTQPSDTYASTVYICHGKDENLVGFEILPVKIKILKK